MVACSITMLGFCATSCQTAARFGSLAPVGATAHQVRKTGAGVWHSTSRSVPDQEHFVAPWAGASVTSVLARGPHADSANSAASRLLKNRFSYHNARYNDLARWNSSGLCRDAPIPRDSLVGSWRRSLHLREYPSRAPANPHRIGRAACLENYRPKGEIDTTGERSFPTSR